MPEGTEDGERVLNLLFARRRTLIVHLAKYGLSASEMSELALIQQSIDIVRDFIHEENARLEETPGTDLAIGSICGPEHSE